MESEDVEETRESNKSPALTTDMTFSDARDSPSPSSKSQVNLGSFKSIQDADYKLNEINYEADIEKMVPESSSSSDSEDETKLVVRPDSPSNEPSPEPPPPQKGKKTKVSQDHSPNESIRTWLQKISQMQTEIQQKLHLEQSGSSGSTNANDHALSNSNPTISSTSSKNHTFGEFPVLKPTPASTANHNPPTSQPSRIVKYQDLPYMGEMTLDNSKPRRGRKPKKADICHLIYKNYGTIFPGTPNPKSLLDKETNKKSNTSEDSPSNRSNVQNRIISSLLEKRLTQESKRQQKEILFKPSKITPQKVEKTASDQNEPLNLCVRDLNQLKIRLFRKSDDIYIPEVKSEPTSDDEVEFIQETPSPSTESLLSPDSGKNLENGPGGYVFWPNAGVFIHPVALQQQLMYYQKMAQNSNYTLPNHSPKPPPEISSPDISLPSPSALSPSERKHTGMSASTFSSSGLSPGGLGSSGVSPTSPGLNQTSISIPGLSGLSSSGLGLSPQGINSQNLTAQGSQALNSQGLNSQGLSSLGLNSQGLNLQGLNLQDISSAGITLSAINPNSSTPSPSGMPELRKLIPKVKSKKPSVDSNSDNDAQDIKLKRSHSEKTPTKRKRSAIFIPPIPTENQTNPATEVSICKFKFTGGAKPSLQEKKMLSVDSGGNFRYYSGTGDKSMRGYEFFPRETLQQQVTNNQGSSTGAFLQATGEKVNPTQLFEFPNKQAHADFMLTPELPAAALPRMPEELSPRHKKRKSRKSLQREKLEQTFKEKGFLIQTQQLESAEGATYCKFRQLRKFTRYLFRSWKDYLPGNVAEVPESERHNSELDGDISEQDLESLSARLASAKNGALSCNSNSSDVPTTV